MKTIPVHTRFTKEVLKLIDAAAAKAELSRSQYISRVVSTAVKK